jgi:hypothetical protein
MASDNAHARDDLRQPKEGTMADKLTPLILIGLSRAAAAAGLPLHGSRTAPGLFPTSAAGKQAAQKCCDDGYLAAVPTEPAAAPTPAEGGGTATAVRKKTAPALFTITDAGLNFLLAQVSPKQVLEDFLRTLQARQGELAELCQLTRQALAATEALHGCVTRALDQLTAPCGAPGSNLKALFRSFLAEPRPDTAPPAAAPDIDPCVLAELQRWQQSGASEDYPLPQLYRHAAEHKSGLTIGQFHDALRRLRDSSKVYLHPWTGPLYDLPEPSHALLSGHGVAYYASVKTAP